MQDEIFIHYGNKRYVLYLSEKDDGWEIILVLVRFEITQFCADWFGENQIGTVLIKNNESEAEETRSLIAQEKTSNFGEVVVKKEINIFGDKNENDNHAWLKMDGVGMELYSSEAAYTDIDTHKKYRVTITPVIGEMYGKKIDLERMKQGGLSYIGNYVRKLLRESKYREQERLK